MCKKIKLDENQKIKLLIQAFSIAKRYPGILNLRDNETWEESSWIIGAKTIYEYFFTRKNGIMRIEETISKFNIELEFEDFIKAVNEYNL